MGEKKTPRRDLLNEEAMDFISYNTLRALPYAGENGPIVLTSIEDYLDYRGE